MSSGRSLTSHDILSDMFPSFFRKSRQNEIDLSNIQAVLFDLDGTLVDVDMNLFVQSYLRRLTEHMSDQVNPLRATQTLHHAAAAMFANTDASRTLESILFGVLQEELALSSEWYVECLARFCQDDLESLRPLVTGHPLSSQLIESSLNRGWKVVLATNPIFPRVVVDARVSWGGMDGDAFYHVAAYETAHFCKPRPLFFKEILDRLQIPAEACLMVGNDTVHDLAASQVGIQTCLLTPWAFKRPDACFEADWKGRHEELLALIEKPTNASAGNLSRLT